MKGLLLFAAGLAVGVVAGAVLVRNKALEDAKQEVEEVREYYRSKRKEAKEEPQEETKEETEEEPEVEVPQDVDIVKNIVKTNGYTNYNKPETIQTVQTLQTVPCDDPYVIDPTDFGEEPGYDTMTLTYFADGVLVDDVDDVIEDKDTVVGLENLKVFEEFGATAVYVRNEIWRTDFEILRDDWNYSDIKEPYEVPVKEKKPHQL